MFAMCQAMPQHLAIKISKYFHATGSDNGPRRGEHCSSVTHCDTLPWQRTANGRPYKKNKYILPHSQSRAMLSPSPLSVSVSISTSISISYSISILLTPHFHDSASQNAGFPMDFPIVSDPQQRKNSRRSAHAQISCCPVICLFAAYFLAETGHAQLSSLG